MPHPAKILLVEDDPVSLALLQKKLEQRDYAPQVASEFEPACELLRYHSFDLVICDFDLVGHTGLDVRRFIWRETPFRPFFVCVSSRSLSHTQAVSLGFDLFLEKPVTPDKIEQLLSAWKARRS